MVENSQYRINLATEFHCAKTASYVDQFSEHLPIQNYFSENYELQCPNFNKYFINHTTAMIFVQRGDKDGI